MYSYPVQALKKRSLLLGALAGRGHARFAPSDLAPGSARVRVPARRLPDWRRHTHLVEEDGPKAGTAVSESA